MENTTEITKDFLSTVFALKREEFLAQVCAGLGIEPETKRWVDNVAKQQLKKWNRWVKKESMDSYECPFPIGAVMLNMTKELNLKKIPNKTIEDAMNDSSICIKIESDPSFVPKEVFSAISMYLTGRLEDFHCWKIGCLNQKPSAFHFWYLFQAAKALLDRNQCVAFADLATEIPSKGGNSIVRLRRATSSREKSTIERVKGYVGEVSDNEENLPEDIVKAIALFSEASLQIGTQILLRQFTLEYARTGSLERAKDVVNKVLPIAFRTDGKWEAKIPTWLKRLEEFKSRSKAQSNNPLL
ncbi:MAG: hypothetical protein NT027_19810 [Proteobacteria bacterium]|nr:hypothetical protein [Pseudomonadota bacterium]